MEQYVTVSGYWKANKVSLIRKKWYVSGGFNCWDIGSWREQSTPVRIAKQSGVMKCIE